MCRSLLKKSAFVCIIVLGPKDFASACKLHTRDCVKKGARAAGNVAAAPVKAAREISKGAAQVTGVKQFDQLAHGFDKTNTELDRIATQAEREIGNGVSNIGEAGRATGRFVDREFRSVRDNLEASGRLISDGKFVDAVWNFAEDSVKDVETNTFRAAHESSMIRVVGQVGASAYGGPGGAAAFAAWYTYKETGDYELALKVGVITGATNAAMSANGKVVSKTTEELVKKSVVGGAIGGLAVAAAGGNADDIEDGMIRAAAMVVIQDRYENYTKQELNGKASSKDATCKGSVGKACSPPNYVFNTNSHGQILDEKGNVWVEGSGVDPSIDLTKMPNGTAQVGLAAKAGETGLLQETGSFMQGVSKVPGMNDMAVAHDMLAANLNPPLLQLTIPPTIVVTYTGLGSPLNEKILKTGIERNEPEVVIPYKLGYAPKPTPTPNP